MSPASLLPLDDLRSGFRGEVLGPRDPGYDAARTIWNGFFDRKPAAIARPVGTPDVIRAVRFAGDHGLTVSVKGGGHNSAGTAVVNDGFMIDLSLMRRAHVNGGGTVRVDGGALLGDLDFETQLHGMAVSAGIVSHTGVGGLTTGGGFGWLSRKHGLSVDNLVSADVVTADGNLVRADARQNPDLFWGIRGGGGNFGIVTSFEFRPAKIGTEVFSGLIVKKFEDTKRYIRFHRDYVRGLPDEMTVWMVIRHAPPLPFLPEEVHGKRVLIVPFVWLGEPGAGAKHLAPVQSATPSVGEAVGMHPWTAWQAAFDPLVAHGARNYWKSHNVLELADGFIDRALEFAERFPSPECEIFMPHMEGAPSRVPEGATAYSNRDVPFNLNIHTRWRDAADDARCMEWARGLHDATKPFARGVYVNFLSEEGEARVRDAYSPEVWKRLGQVKAAWDPKNFFRVNQNIKPSAG